MSRYDNDNDCGIILFGLFLFCGCAIGGSLLVYYNYKTVCDTCTSGYNSTMINGVQSCASDINGLISSYNQCHTYYQEPGFGFGCFMLAICWVMLGGPAVIIIPG
jgi:hypothetical protein